VRLGDLIEVAEKELQSDNKSEKACSLDVQYEVVQIL